MGQDRDIKITTYHAYEKVLAPHGQDILVLTLGLVETS